MEYASKGVATAGLTTGIIGTSLAALGSGLLSGVLNGGNPAMATTNNVVGKEVFEVEKELALERQKTSILTSELNTEKKMVEVYNATNDKINAVYEKVSDRILVLEKQVADNAAAQAVINCGFNSAINLLQNQVGQLFALTKLGIPNSSLCPGYGAVEVKPVTTTT